MSIIKLAPGDTLPPARLYHLLFPTQCHQLGPKCPNTQAYREQSPFQPRHHHSPDTSAGRLLFHLPRFLHVYCLSQYVAALLHLIKGHSIGASLRQQCGTVPRFSLLSPLKPTPCSQHHLSELRKEGCCSPCPVCVLIFSVIASGIQKHYKCFLNRGRNAL